MTKPIQEMSGWNATDFQPLQAAEDDAWQTTRAQPLEATQAMAGKEDILSNVPRGIGRKVGPDQHELFVTCDPADAMRQQFEHFRPEFIAVHDIGTTSSSRLLGGLAAASGQSPQKLVIRRQGYGMALATLTFIELPNPQGAPLRLYTTEADADTRQRQALANVLIACSTLGVLMVGDLPAHALAAALQPLREALRAGPWPNRHLLLLPLASPAALASQAALLVGPAGLNVSTTPQVKRPAEAWAFIQGSWERLSSQRAGGQSGPATAGAPLDSPILSAEARSGFSPTAAMHRFNETRPAPLTSPAPLASSLPLRPMPDIPPPRPAAASPSDLVAQALEGEALLNEYVQHCLAIKGMVSCCVFDLELQRPLAHAGNRPGPAALAFQGAALHQAMSEAGRALGLGAQSVEAAVSIGGHQHLLLRALPGQDGLILHAVVDTGNLALARIQVERLDALLE